MVHPKATTKPAGSPPHRESDSHTVFTHANTFLRKLGGSGGGGEQHMMNSTPSKNRKNQTSLDFTHRRCIPPIPLRRAVVGPATQLRRRGQWEDLNQQCSMWKCNLLNKDHTNRRGGGVWVTPIDTFWGRGRLKKGHTNNFKVYLSRRARCLS